ncbi:MAG TPA: transposase [Terriglobales bacterium]|nr:transposase [Terriglobales bacterium]
MLPGTLPATAWLSAAYAALLAATAAALEWTARRVHRRAESYKTAGFSYEREHDRWRCPTGNLLHRRSADHHRARVIYRAPAHLCNGCSLKHQCTDSDQGRTLVIAPEAWVGSTMERFHRGLSLALLLLAELVLAAGYWLRPNWLPMVLLLALGAVALRIAQRFFQAGSQL